MNLNLFKIYFGVAFSLLAAATAWASAPLVQIAENDTLLIDDFEDGDYNSNLGVWESFTGEGYNATFERSIVDSEEKNSKVLRIDYEFQDEQENNGWEWMETRVLVANYTSLDFSNCTEIQFDYKADYQNNSAYDNWLDLRFRIEGDDENAYVETDYHSMPLDASDDWQTVTVHWNDFFQDGWGINLPVETVQKNMLAFGWFWHTEHAAQGTIELDNFRCINQPKYEVTFMADGKVFASDMYYSGTTPRDPLEECKYYDHCTRPTKEPSETMMYTFKEWDKNIEPVTAPVVYTALFDSTVIPRGVPLNMVGDTLLLENFEDGNGVGLLGGTWEFFDALQTEESGSTSSIETVPENKILGIGNLAEPEEPYEWLGARLYLLEDCSAVDMSQCEAIQYRYKGESHQFRVESEYENGWQHYHKDLPSSDDWTTANIDWNRLEGYEWVDEGNLPLKQVGVIKKKVVALTWQKDNFYIDAEGNGLIEIDDIQCIAKETSSSSSSEESSSSEAVSSSSEIIVSSSSVEIVSSSSEKVLSSSSNGTTESSSSEESSSSSEEHSTVVYGGGFAGLQLGYSRNTLTVSVEKSSTVRIHIFDMKGQLLLKEEAIIAGSRGLDLGRLNRGNYIVYVSTQHGTKSIRVSVK